MAPNLSVTLPPDSATSAASCASNSQPHTNASTGSTTAEQLYVRLGRVPIVVLVFLCLTLLLLHQWGSSYVDATVTARHVLHAAWRRETASVAAQLAAGVSAAAALDGSCGPAHLAVQLNATSAELNLYNFYRIGDAEIAAATADCAVVPGDACLLYTSPSPRDS